MAVRQTGRGIRGWIASAIVPREILIRSDGRVRYITLSSRFQATFSLAMAGALCWLTYSSIGVVLSEIRLSTMNAEREEAKSAYVGMLNELADYYDQFANMADGLAQNQTGLLGKVEVGAIERQAANPLRQAIEKANQAITPPADDIKAYEAGLLTLLASGADPTADPATLRERLRTSEQALTGNMAEIKERLRLSEDEADRVVEARRRIAGQLSEAESRLERASDQGGMLARTLAGLRGQLVEAQRSEATHTTDRARLNAQMDTLARQLENTREARAKMEEKAQALSQQVNLADIDRSQLELKISDMATGLDAAAAEKKRLEEQVDSVQEALAAVIGQRNALYSARNELQAQVTRLEERVAMIQSSQDDAMEQIIDRTRGNVDLVEKTVAMTGLDVDMLLARVEAKEPSRGGPFIPASSQGVSDVLLASVASLDDEVNRWDRLQTLLRSLPLVTPVDHFTIGSLFGKRKDPFNGRLSNHEGLDLAASSGMPIMATAPGRVVFAGWRGNYGRMVEIDHGLGIHTIYGHMRSIAVKVGDEVDYRDKIGTVGSSGRSTGPHVHFEVVVDGKPRDPMLFVKAGRYVFKG